MKEKKNGNDDVLFFIINWLNNWQNSRLPTWVNNTKQIKSSKNFIIKYGGIRSSYVQLKSVWVSEMACTKNSSELASDADST